VSARTEPAAPTLRLRTQVLLWAAQRATALVLAICVLVHLVTAIYAIRSGLSAAEILSRTRGNAGWAVFYAVFVGALAVHAPIGLRNILAETLQWRGRSLDCVMLLVALALAYGGWRAVYGVVAGG
jgi:fumarate reductase subunit C